MEERIAINYEMRLVSDAIFSAGYSIPGGKDITVYRDGNGYPYFRGTGMKGLLRESTENLLCWLPDENDHSALSSAGERLSAMFGTEDRNGISDSHRIQFTPLTLKTQPELAEQCYAERTFTRIENGTAAEGSLRTADCIRRGLIFCGSLICHKQDADLLQEALCCIKWAGSLRSRGFGQVSFRVTERAEYCSDTDQLLKHARCIHYRLHTELPVLITNLQGSTDNSYASRDYIPGSAIRGMVISSLAQNADHNWFLENRKALLSDDTRFLNAMPNPAHKAVLPVIKGFYEDKQEQNFSSVLRKDIAGLKRAKMGNFCAVEHNTISCWSGKTEGVLRIGRNKKDDGNSTPFQTSYICAGQDFDGYILLDRPELAEEITEILSGEIWIGADRYEGFGKCTVTLLESVEQPEWQRAYGYSEKDHVGDTLYLLAVSPFTMRGKAGNSCGLDLEALAEQLGIVPESMQVNVCSTSMSEYGAYNRTWGCREPAERMYDAGSIFRLKCAQVPSASAIQQVQRNGIGIRRSEGYGQILFMKPACFEAISRKEKLRECTAEEAGQTAEMKSAQAIVRRARYRWIMEQAKAVRKLKLSNSQLGTVQSVFEEAIRSSNTIAPENYIRENVKKRNVIQEERYREFSRFIKPVLKHKLSETLNCREAGDGDDAGKLKLLVELFNFSRKECGEA